MATRSTTPAPVPFRPFQSKDLQACVDAAYAEAFRLNVPVFIVGKSIIMQPHGHHDTTTHRPSRFRCHYRIEPDGTLWSYRSPHLDGMPVNDVADDLEYTQIV